VLILVHRWRCVQFETGSAFKLDLKNNGVVRRSSQDSDVSEVFSSLGSVLIRCFAENMHTSIHACNNFTYLECDTVGPSVFSHRVVTHFIHNMHHRFTALHLQNFFLVWNFYGMTLQGK
jgi:hypothetical protein